jgi:adenylate kinase
MFGPPGAGKGTQSENLAKDLNLFKVSTGDLLREEVKNKSSLGIKIKNIIDNGLLVSDDIIDNLIEKILSNKNYFNKLIFDGYPRNLNQAKHLDLLIKKYNQRISCVLSLKIEKDIIIKRILGRIICSKCKLTFNEYFYPPTKENHKCNLKFLTKRSDDNKQTVENRLETYTKTTLQILNYYQNQKLLYEIDGMGEISNIYKEIRQIIHSLET